MLIATNKYGRYSVPESSMNRPAAQTVLRGEVWEPETIALIREWCGDGDVVHAGTYFGDFLPGLSNALSPEANLWAFEPSPQNATHARQTIDLNGLSNVVFRECALGDEDDRKSLATFDNRGRDMGGLSRLHDGTGTMVDVVRLDDVIPENRSVSVIQLDVEGYEEQALCGGIETVRRCLPLLILEDWDGRLVEGEWFGETILPLGYVRKRNVHENAVFEVER